MNVGSGSSLRLPITRKTTMTTVQIKRMTNSMVPAMVVDPENHSLVLGSSDDQAEAQNVAPCASGVVASSNGTGVQGPVHQQETEREVDRIILPHELRKRPTCEETPSEVDRNTLGQQVKAIRTGLRLLSERRPPSRLRHAEWVANHMTRVLDKNGKVMRTSVVECHGTTEKQCGQKRRSELKWQP
jgi:hypothetical protein